VQRGNMLTLMARVVGVGCFHSSWVGVLGCEKARRV
jgi:hydroxyethylthiazole kinase-like sugar kinase family protein